MVLFQRSGYIATATLTLGISYIIGEGNVQAQLSITSWDWGPQHSLWHPENDNWCRVYRPPVSDCFAWILPPPPPL